MEVHAIHCLNKHYYKNEVEQDFRNRHRIFVEEKRWENLRREDGRERDEFDGPDTTHLLLLENGAVIGGLRLTPLDRPNLLLKHFGNLVQRPLPDAIQSGADWTRFYVTERRFQKMGPSSPAGALYCAAMEYAVLQGWTYLTFVSKPAMVEILVSMGWKVTPLGMPRLIEGEMTLAGAIAVDEGALFQARMFNGQRDSLLRDRMVEDAAPQWASERLEVVH
ncbi:MAG: acyl-homoserine-lactone synthase [Devosia sp.]